MTRPKNKGRHDSHSSTLANRSSRLIVLFFVLALTWSSTAGLDCFKCGSMNGSNPQCGDPFHHNHSSDFLASPCLAGWKGRDGLFPSTHCVKLSGYFYETSEPLVVRGCTTDSGTLTTDTELARQSHCGLFIYDGKTVVGCVESCNEFDACNASHLFVTMSPALQLLCILLFVFFHL